RRGVSSPQPHPPPQGPARPPPTKRGARPRGRREAPRRPTTKTSPPPARGGEPPPGKGKSAPAPTPTTPTLHPAGAGRPEQFPPPGAQLPAPCPKQPDAQAEAHVGVVRVVIGADERPERPAQGLLCPVDRLRRRGQLDHGKQPQQAGVEQGRHRQPPQGSSRA